MTAKPDIERLRELRLRTQNREIVMSDIWEMWSHIDRLTVQIESTVPRAWWEELRRMVTGCHISQPAVVCDEKHSLATGFDNQRRILDWIQFQMARIEEGK